MQHRGAVFHRFKLIEHKRVRLVLRFNGAHGFLRRDLVFCYNRRDVIPIIQRPVRQHEAVGNVGMSLTIAFSAVILALIAAAITFLIVGVRRRWLAEEMLWLNRQVQA